MRFISAFTLPTNISDSFLDRHLGLSQSSRDTISILFKDILLHNLTQLSWLSNKIVILHCCLMCSDSPVVTFNYYCLLSLLSFSSILILYTLILWLHYRGLWYSYYSHNHPWFIKENRVRGQYFLKNIFLFTTFIPHEVNMDLKES